MADTISPLLRLILQEQFANTNLWGNIWNGGAADLLDEAIGGVANIDVTLGNVTLASQNGQSDNSRPMFLRIFGNPGAAVTVTVPTLSKLYFVKNNTSPAFTVNIKTAASASFSIAPSQSPAVIFVDAANNRIRTIGRAGAIVPMDAWTTFVLAFSNATAGDTSINCRYAKQGHLVFFEVPGFSVTTSTGVLASASTLPAAIRPGTAQGFGVVATVAYPVFIEGNAANVEWAFIAQANGVTGFSNIGTGSPSAPDTYTLPGKHCFVWSTRGP